MRFFVSTSPITAWIAGLIGFFGASFAASEGSFNIHDVPAILIWAAFGMLMTLPIMFWPGLLLLEWILNGRHPLFAFPLFGAMLALPITLLAGLVFGGNPLNMPADEFALTLSFFAPVGVVSGFAFVFRPALIEG